ncbi:hypothetical protein VUR80DRAFT_2673 [Thermomyces stellatus]
MAGGPNRHDISMEVRVAYKLPRETSRTNSAIFRVIIWGPGTQAHDLPPENPSPISLSTSHPWPWEAIEHISSAGDSTSQFMRNKVGTKQ